MIQHGTILKICDNTGVLLVQCIKVLSTNKKNIAKLGDVIVVSVKKYHIKKVQQMKLRKRRRYSKGSIHRALIVRTKVNYEFLKGVYIKFDENTAILVNKRVVPISNRVYGPILKLLCMK
jgi:large subunit ribosomal protein L14